MFHSRVSVLVFFALLFAFDLEPAAAGQRSQSVGCLAQVGGLEFAAHAAQTRLCVIPAGTPRGDIPAKLITCHDELRAEISRIPRPYGSALHVGNLACGTPSDCPNYYKLLRGKIRWLEGCLQEYSRELSADVDAIKSRLEDLKKAGAALNAPAIAAGEAEVNASEDTLTAISKDLRLVRQDSLVLDHRNYAPWVGQFFAGAEYASINDIPDGDLFPRIGLLSYRNFATWQRFQRPHAYLAAQVRSSAEITVQTALNRSTGTTPPATAADPANPPEEIENALEFQTGIFYPLVEFGSRPGEERWHRELFGPIVEVSAVKVDEKDDAVKRYYGGLRLATSPYFYFDLLYGKTEGLGAKRWAVRAQMPVRRATANSRFFIGADLSMKAEKPGFRQNDPATTIDESLLRKVEPDSFRVYFTWETEFEGIFGWLNPG